MVGQTTTMLVAVAALAVYLIFVVALQYTTTSRFTRMRLVMTGLFVYVVFTLTWAFWDYAIASLGLSSLALLGGLVVGRYVGVPAAQERMSAQGKAAYREHFAHVHPRDIAHLQWWSVINYYSIMAALVVINLTGLSDVWFAGHQGWALFTCAVGAFLVGSIVPYLVHLWDLD